MRWFGLDVHRGCCEVADADDDGVRSAGRIATRVPTLERLLDEVWTPEERTGRCGG